MCELPELIKELQGHGYSQKRIGDISGLNQWTICRVQSDGVPRVVEVYTKAEAAIRKELKRIRRATA